jgi:hypothetical protein
MYKELQAHLAFMDSELQHPTKDKKELQSFNRAQISFFQHERFIHLLITLFFGSAFLAVSLTLVCTILLFEGSLESILVALTALDALLLVLLVPYIIYYFLLENGVQRLYVFDKKLERS